MKTRIRLLARLVCVALTVFFLAACANPSASMPTPNAATEWALSQAALPTKVPPGTIKWRNEIVSEALADNLLGDPATRNYIVYLPLGYDASDTRYPVVYVLHGYTGAPSMFARQTSSSMDLLIANNEIKPMILVFPDAGNKLGGSWYLRSPTIGDYETYISKELVSQIDSMYRTLPNRDSRGITGCSMGGFGAAHLALNYPDVFSVAAPMSAPYEWDSWLDTTWEDSRTYISVEPHEFRELDSQGGTVPAFFLSLAAATAPNPDRPPFYLDMPFRLVNGEPQIVPEVLQRMAAHDPVSDLQRYLGQPIRLRGLMIYQDTNNDANDPYTVAASAFDRTLTQVGVEHEFLQVEASHCNGDWAPILEFMSNHLAH